MHAPQEKQTRTGGAPAAQLRAKSCGDGLALVDARANLGLAGALAAAAPLSVLFVHFDRLILWQQAVLQQEFDGHLAVWPLLVK